MATLFFPRTTRPEKSIKIHTHTFPPVCTGTPLSGSVPTIRQPPATYLDTDSHPHSHAHSWLRIPRPRKQHMEEVFSISATRSGHETQREQEYYTPSFLQSIYSEQKSRHQALRSMTSPKPVVWALVLLLFSLFFPLEQWMCRNIFACFALI